MIEPIKRFRIGKALLLSISQPQMHDDIRRRVRTHDPLLLLPTSPAANGSSTLWMYPAPQVFRYTGRQSFGAVYTLCFKGGDKWPGYLASRCIIYIAMKRTQLYLDDDIARILSIMSRQRGQTISELVRECIREKFEEKKRSIRPNWHAS